MKRERFGSRLGFILVSAGCAIGIGNVWKFPYICGAYGGAAFILIYLAFLLILGIPVLVCEFAVGRGSRKSVALSFEELAPEGTLWYRLKYIGIFGCYLLMMFYTMVGGWMMYYCYRSLVGEFTGASPEQIADAFGGMLLELPTMAFWTILICIIGFAVCTSLSRTTLSTSLSTTAISFNALTSIGSVLASRTMVSAKASLTTSTEAIKFFLFLIIFHRFVIRFFLSVNFIVSGLSKTSKTSQMYIYSPIYVGIFLQTANINCNNQYKNCFNITTLYP